MFNRESAEASILLAESAIAFRRKGGGYYYPDRLIDRHAITLTGIQYIPTNDPDKVISQFANKAWVEIKE